MVDTSILDQNNDKEGNKQVERLFKSKLTMSCPELNFFETEAEQWIQDDRKRGIC
jgi:hypothetical protein